MLISHKRAQLCNGEEEAASSISPAYAVHLEKGRKQESKEWKVMVALTFPFVTFTGILCYLSATRKGFRHNIVK